MHQAEPQPRSEPPDLWRAITAIVDQGRLCDLSGNATKLLIVIARKTHGWHKSADDLSFNQLAALTGIPRQHVTRALTELETAGLVLIERQPNKPNHITLVLDPPAPPRPALATQTRLIEVVPKRDYPTNQGGPKTGLQVVPKRDQGVPKMGLPPSPKMGPTTTNTHNYSPTTKETTTLRALDSSVVVFIDAFGLSKSIRPRLIKRIAGIFESADVPLSRASPWLEWATSVAQANDRVEVPWQYALGVLEQGLQEHDNPPAPIALPDPNDPYGYFNSKYQHLYR